MRQIVKRPYIRILIESSFLSFVSFHLIYSLIHFSLMMTICISHSDSKRSFIIYSRYREDFHVHWLCLWRYKVSYRIVSRDRCNPKITLAARLNFKAAFFAVCRSLGRVYQVEFRALEAGQFSSPTASSWELLTGCRVGVPGICCWRHTFY